MVQSAASPRGWLVLLIWCNFKRVRCKCTDRVQISAFCSDELVQACATKEYLNQFHLKWVRWSHPGKFNWILQTASFSRCSAPNRRCHTGLWCVIIVSYLALFSPLLSLNQYLLHLRSAFTMRLTEAYILGHERWRRNELDTRDSCILPMSLLAAISERACTYAFRLVLSFC